MFMIDAQTILAGYWANSHLLTLIHILITAVLYKPVTINLIQIPRSKIAGPKGLLGSISSMGHPPLRTLPVLGLIAKQKYDFCKLFP